MPVQYQELTAEQRDGLRKQKLFEAEYAHYLATIDLTTAPADPTKIQAVAQLEPVVTALQALVLNPPQDAGPAEPG